MCIYTLRFYHIHHIKTLKQTCTEKGLISDLKLVVNLIIFQHTPTS